MSVIAIEACYSVGLYGYGDVKTMTARYPVAALQEACDSPAGSWSVMTSNVANLRLGAATTTIPIYCIGHRRGGEVHTYIASCGTTIRGTRLSLNLSLSLSLRRRLTALTVTLTFNVKVNDNVNVKRSLNLNFNVNVKVRLSTARASPGARRGAPLSPSPSL
jgi:hypothetical protein